MRIHDCHDCTTRDCKELTTESRKSTTRNHDCSQRLINSLVIHHQSSIIHHQLSIITHQSSIISHPSCHQSSIISHQSSIICHQSSVIQHQSSFISLHPHPPPHPISPYPESTPLRLCVLSLPRILHYGLRIAGLSPPEETCNPGDPMFGMMDAMLAQVGQHGLLCRRSRK